MIRSSLYSLTLGGATYVIPKLFTTLCAPSTPNVPPPIIDR